MQFFFFVNIYSYFCLLQKGLTALHIASSHGCRGIVEMLLAADCDIDRQSKVNIIQKTGRVKTKKKKISIIVSFFDNQNIYVYLLTERKHASPHGLFVK